MSDEQIAALLSVDISCDMFSEEEKALLEFVDQVIERPEVDEETFAKARKHFNDQILVEIVTMQVRPEQTFRSGIPMTKEYRDSITNSRG